MKLIISILIFAFCWSASITWADPSIAIQIGDKSIELHTGTVIAFSSRGGVTPFVFQSLLQNPFDHIGIVIIKEGFPMFVEYTNSAGISSQKLEDVIRRQKKGLSSLTWALADPIPLLNAEEQKKIIESLDLWVKDYQQNRHLKYSSCTKLVSQAYAEIGRLVGIEESLSEIKMNSFRQFIFNIIPKAMIEKNSYFITPQSILNDMKIIFNNGSPKELWTSDRMLDTWMREGDWSALVRLYEAYEKEAQVGKNGIAAGTQKLQDKMKNFIVSDSEVLLSLPVNDQFEYNKIHPGERLGIFIGTFDPLTKGHESVINEALVKGLVDRVILIANKKPFWKPQATSYSVRLEMLKYRFAKAQKVMVFDGKSSLVPSPLELAFELRRKFGKSITISGIYGGDSLKSSFKLALERALVSFYDGVIIFNRENKGENGFPKTIMGREVKVLPDPQETDSSTSVRKFLADSPEFYQSNLSVFKTLSQRVSPAVLQFIKKNKLYSNLSMKTLMCLEVYLK